MMGFPYNLYTEETADIFKFSESKSPILQMLSKDLCKNKSKLYSHKHIFLIAASNSWDIQFQDMGQPFTMLLSKSLLV
jgi:hypothetical protein